MSKAREVETAKVSRSTAIWVAAITAVGGFATALVTGSFGLVNKPTPPTPSTPPAQSALAPPPAPAPVQRWLRVESVQLGSDPALPAVDRVRLVAQVNGVSYAYPTSLNSLWAAVGPGMVGERYPLPLGTEPLRVRFYGFGLAADNKVPRYESRDYAEHPRRQLPVRGATQALYPTGSAPSNLAVGMTVRYSIE